MSNGLWAPPTAAYGQGKANNTADICYHEGLSRVVFGRPTPVSYVTLQRSWIAAISSMKWNENEIWHICLAKGQVFLRSECCKLPLKTTKEDKDEKEGDATACLAAANEISEDALEAAVLWELDFCS